MLEQNSLAPKFLDLVQKNPITHGIHRACDSVYRKLHQQGVVHHAAIIPEAEEEKLWVTGIVGILTPRGLHRAIFTMWGNA